MIWSFVEIRSVPQFLQQLYVFYVCKRGTQTTDFFFRGIMLARSSTNTSLFFLFVCSQIDSIHSDKIYG